MTQASAPPADSLQAALDAVFAGPAYHWVERRGPLDWLAAYWQRLQVWLEALREMRPELFTLFTWALIVVLAAILLHAAYVLFLTVQPGATASDYAAGAAPAERRDADWHRRRADRLAAERRYAEAMRALFQAVVLDLDGRGAVRYVPGKTPSEYAREARLAAPDRRRLADLVRALYRYAFGGRPCDADAYRQWRDGTLEEWHVAAG